MSTQRSLAELLNALAEVMFPGDDPPGVVSLQSTNGEDETPLHIYLWRGDSKAAHTLVKSGADVNALGDMGETPLHVAVRTCGVETLALLLQAGARSNIVSEFGQTPLQLAESIDRHEVLHEAMQQVRKQPRSRPGKRRG